MAIRSPKTSLSTGEQPKDRKVLEIDASGNITRANLQGAWAYAEQLAQSQLVPKTYQGKPADCLIACQMAMRCKIHPMTFLQGSQVIHGKCQVSGKLAAAMLLASPHTQGRIKYEECGTRPAPGTSKDKLKKSDWGMRAGIRDNDGDWHWSEWITLQLAASEGWIDRNDKWVTMFGQMARYRSCSWLLNGDFSDVAAGLSFEGENEEATETEAERVERILAEQNRTINLGGEEVPEDEARERLRESFLQQSRVADAKREKERATTNAARTDGGQLFETAPDAGDA